MPLALDYESEFSLTRPTKRRRVSEELNMARRPNADDNDSHCGGQQDDTLPEAGCETLTNTVESALPQSDIQISDRDELIQCIKRGQRPTWVPKPALQALYAEEEALQVKRNADDDQQSQVSPKNTSFQFEHDLLFGSWTGTNETIAPPRPEVWRPQLRRDEEAELLDFSEPNVASSYTTETSSYFPRQSPEWFNSPTPPQIGQAISSIRNLHTSTPTRLNRPRAPSLSSSLVMRVPTSPLVNAVNNPNLDFSPRSGLNDDVFSERSSRRKTMPPSSFQSLSPSSNDTNTPNFSRPLLTPMVRRDSSLPHQVHQPRRSIGSFTFQSGLGGHTPRSPGRRLSLAVDASPMRRTSMVGSFEESILRGRMSSPASKPFDFVAQIGVMGKGDCAANLKCPAHVSVPFQAVFYSYPSTQNLRSIADDTPSPYVGTIDIEHSLKPVQLATKQRKSIAPVIQADESSLLGNSDPRAPENTAIGKALARDAQLEQQQRQGSRSGSISGPRVNLGGAYRVPQQGQLQIIIKNSNKTAVKLFLVSYDLQGMEPGTKTFIRQKSYSSGPIVEGALSDKAIQPTVMDPLKDKSILRYLIHIRFCCPSKGKYYIYDNIRVVFANRVPDGKEKLRTDVQLPEPRYSPWKPTTNHHHRPSRLFSVSDFVPEDLSLHHPSPPTPTEDSPPPRLRGGRRPPEDKPSKGRSLLPFHFANMVHKSDGETGSAMGSDEAFRGFTNLSWQDVPLRQAEPPLSSVQGFFASTSPRSSPVLGISSGSSTTRSFSPAPVEAGAGLLSRQLRGLHGSVSSLGDESVADPWTATATLSRILSQEESPPGDTKESST